VHASTVVPGAELFLHHARVIEAAQQFYDAEVIVPHTVYVNLMGPTAAPGPAHTDNHGMFHQVMPIGGAGDAPVLVTARAELAPASHGEWSVVDDGREVWRAPLESIRVSVLWKAHVYENESERERLAADTIGHNDVVRIFNDDLARRGERLRLDPAGIADPRLSDELRRVYPDATPVGAGGAWAGSRAVSDRIP
jgi:hypothetical protein